MVILYWERFVTGGRTKMEWRMTIKDTREQCARPAERVFTGATLFDAALAAPLLPPEVAAMIRAMRAAVPPPGVAEADGPPQASATTHQVTGAEHQQGRHVEAIPKCPHAAGAPSPGGDGAAV